MRQPILVWTVYTQKLWEEAASRVLRVHVLGAGTQAEVDYYLVSIYTK